MKTLEKIRKTVNDDNYKFLKLQCYVCDVKDHIAINCPEFGTIEGNIRNYFEKRKQESHISEENEPGSPSLKGSFKKSMTQGKGKFNGSDKNMSGSMKKKRNTIAVNPLGDS
jgi:hypothetical protein